MNIIILGGRGESTNAVVNALADRYDELSLIQEDSVPIGTFLRKRMKRLGVATVLGQVAFMVAIPPYLRKKSINRIENIKQMYALNVDDHYQSHVKYYSVNSVNDAVTIDIIQRCRPDIVVVNGTRIISRQVLETVQVPIINMHMGITPKYRGVHGGYWALVSGDAEHCGVTVHMVNAGIDTGGIIRQKQIMVEKEDNFVTYPYIQAGEGIRLELEILDGFEKSGRIETKDVDLPSMIWSHPTLWQYLKNRRMSR